MVLLYVLVKLKDKIVQKDRLVVLDWHVWLTELNSHANNLDKMEQNATQTPNVIPVIIALEMQ